MRILLLKVLNLEHKKIPQASIKELVEEIVAVNHAWKVASDLFEETSPLVVSLRDMKASLQVRLLRYCYPQVFLKLDLESDGEQLYSLRLQQPIGNRDNAEHLPVRVAKERLSLKEIEQFTK